MSIRIMTAAWNQPLRSTEKLVLLALADNANDDGVCWPSITTIAAKCSLSRQGVLNQIASLETQKLVSATRESGKSTRYKITIPVNHVDQSTELTSQPSGPPPVNHVDHGQSTTLTTPVYDVDPNHQEPSVEPSVEPSLPGFEEKQTRKSSWSPSSEQIRVGSWYNRRPTTPWSDKELAAWRKADKSDESISLLEKYYTADIAGKDIRRHDLLTLLNNWNGEIDRARKFVASHKPKDFTF